MNSATEQKPEYQCISLSRVPEAKLPEPNMLISQGSSPALDRPLGKAAGFRFCSLGFKAHLITYAALLHMPMMILLLHIYYDGQYCCILFTYTYTCVYLYNNNMYVCTRRLQFP